MKRLGQFFIFALLISVTFPFALLPYRLSLRLGDLLGFLIFIFWKSRRHIAIENLRSAIERGAITVDEDPRALIYRNFKNLGRLAIEINKIYYGFSRSLFRNIEIKGVENFMAAQKRNKGVLIISGHCGNWELLAVYLSKNLTRGMAVARRQSNQYINRFILKTRQKYGSTIVYKDGALKKMLSALRDGDTVGVMMDQSVAKSEGLITRFLGKNAYTIKTPALLARKTDAAVLPVFIRRTEKGHLIEIGEQISLDKTEDKESALLHDTVNFIKPIEEYIKKNPSEWLWIHRRWKKIKD